MIERQRFRVMKVKAPVLPQLRFGQMLCTHLPFSPHFPHLCYFPHFRAVLRPYVENKPLVEPKVHRFPGPYTIHLAAFQPAQPVRPSCTKGYHRGTETSSPATCGLRYQKKKNPAFFPVETVDKGRTAYCYWPETFAGATPSFQVHSSFVFHKE